MERQLGNKTRVTVDKVCLKPYQSNFCCLDQMTSQKSQYSRNNSHMIMILVTFCWKTYTNSSPKESVHLQLMILAFSLIFRPYFGEYACNWPHKRWHHSNEVNLQIHFWGASTNIWVGQVLAISAMALIISLVPRLPSLRSDTPTDLIIITDILGSCFCFFIL